MTWNEIQQFISDETNIAYSLITIIDRKYNANNTSVTIEYSTPQEPTLFMSYDNKTKEVTK